MTDQKIEEFLKLAFNAWMLKEEKRNQHPGLIRSLAPYLWSAWMAGFEEALKFDEAINGDTP